MKEREMSELRQVYVTNDGQIFNSRKEFEAYSRRPKIQTALAPVTEGNKSLSEWLIENQSEIENAFAMTKSRRVTISERKKLEKALDVLVEIQNPKLAFLQENASVILSEFRWPRVPRDDEEKEVLVKKALLELTMSEDLPEGKPDLVDWIFSNKDAIEEAYSAGKVKRPVSPQAAEGLAAYQAKRRAEKEAADRAKAEAEANSAA
jgi:hypothetical protein